MSDAEEQIAPASVKKGRGRPRKSVIDLPAANGIVSSLAAGPKRGRGRPRKVQSAPSASAHRASGSLAPGPVNQGPGRPSKELNATPSVSTPNLAANDGIPIKKPRGRPRKDAAAPSAAASLTNPPTLDGSTLATRGGQVKRARGRPRKDGAPPMQSAARAIPSLNLRQCRGNYSITCPEITEQWDNMDGLSMDICDGSTHGTLLAAMDFGVVEGTMILSMARDVPVDDEDSDMNEDENSDDGDEGDATSYQGLGKRKASPSKPDWPENVASSSPSRRLYLRWRGRDTGTGEIYFDASLGFIDFNNYYTSISGTLFSVPGAGRVEFKGRKVDKAPRTQPEPWSAFSEAAYVKAEQSRWH